MRRLALILTCSVLLGAACAGEAPDCPGGWCATAVVVSLAEADVLTPGATTLDIGFAISDLIFLKLADVGLEMNTVDLTTFEPELASHWEFEDARTIVFTLHPEATWQDGEPVTAQDVVFTWEVHVDTLVGSSSAPRLKTITSVTARDERTVVFRFTEQYPEMFYDAVYHMRILPHHLLGDVPRDEFVAHEFGRNPVGNGPYRFVQWNAGESIELAADSNFFLGRPGVRRIIWRFTPDLNTAYAQFLAGETDLLQIVPFQEVVRVAQEEEGLRVIPHSPTTNLSYLLFNTRDGADPDRPHPLFGERGVREAIAMAVDRAAAVRAVEGENGIVGRGPVSPAMWIWNEEYEEIPFDTARARARLAELGWSDTDGDGVLDRNGTPLAFDILLPSTSWLRRRYAEIVQEQLRQVGVAVTLDAIDFGAFSDRGRAGRFDMFFGGYGGDPSPGTMEELWGTGAAVNYSGYSNLAVDRLMQRASQAADIEDAGRLWHRAAVLIAADLPALWMSHPSPSAGVNGRFENVSIRGDNFSATLWQWRVPADRRIDRDLYGN
jgi:peptide/nickel transport system substrate-binding protein